MIELRDVSFGYDKKTLLKNISMRINEGEFITITGPNGSGKTTLSLLLAGILKPQKGEVIIDGKKSSESKVFEEGKKSVGIVFENPDNQFITTSVERELAFGLENIGVEGKEIRRKVDESLGSFHLEHLRFRPPHTLSGGEKQKIAVASILILNPRYIILDEPTTYLDPPSRRMLIETIENFKGTISVILISHFPEEIMLGEKIYFLKDRKLAQQTREEVILQSRGLDFLHFLSNKGIWPYSYLPEPEVLCDAIELFKRNKSKGRGRRKLYPV